MNPGPVLVIGYGNPARGDDGLAPAFVESLDRLQLPGVETRNQYQLCVEDAMDMAGFAQVVFVDASLDAASPFEFSPLREDAVRHMDTHTLSPGALMYLARTLFGSTASAFVMAIRGYRFEAFTETITNEAQRNLREAIDFFTDLKFRRTLPPPLPEGNDSGDGGGRATQDAKATGNPPALPRASICRTQKNML